MKAVIHRIAVGGGSGPVLVMRVSVRMPIRLQTVDLAQVAHELYGLPPSEFVAARAAHAKQATREDSVLAAQIRKLPKPSVAAYVVNQLVRARHDDVEQLIELGAALRQAQVGLDGVELRKLDQQRRQLTRAVAAQGKALAAETGTSVSAAAAVQVDETLHAAMADPDAAEAVRSGRLSRSLSASGFGPVDVTDAVAAPAALASVTSLTDKRTAAARAQAERAMIAARADLVAAEREAAEAAAVTRRAREALDVVRSRRDDLTAEVRRLREALADTERQMEEVKADRKRAKRDLAKAESAEAEAVEARENARAELDRLTAEVQQP
jgi:hypothetical protein